MSHEIRVYVKPVVGDGGWETFATSRRHDAARIIAFLTRLYGQGTLTDYHGAVISADPGANLQPVDYTFTLDSTYSSLFCPWQVHPSESHLVHTNDINGLGRLQHLSAAVICGTEAIRSGVRLPTAAATSIQQPVLPLAASPPTAACQ